MTTIADTTVHTEITLSPINIHSTHKPFSSQCTDVNKYSNESPTNHVVSRELPVFQWRKRRVLTFRTVFGSCFVLSWRTLPAPDGRHGGKSVVKTWGKLLKFSRFGLLVNNGKEMIFWVLFFLRAWVPLPRTFVEENWK